MDDFITIMSFVYDILKTPISFWGFTISLWSIFIWTTILTIAFNFLGMLLDL